MTAEAGPAIGSRAPRCSRGKAREFPLMSHPDFADPKTNADPFPIFSQLRESDPVHWSTALKAWVITRYDDVRRVAVSNSDMSAERSAPFFATVPAESQGGYANSMTYLGKWMVFRDPPEHTR
ncbi:hypothetical protein OY671_012182, partial [Metschnikowia pulcherrima]